MKAFLCRTLLISLFVTTLVPSASSSLAADEDPCAGVTAWIGQIALVQGITSLSEFASDIIAEDYVAEITETSQAVLDEIVPPAVAIETHEAAVALFSDDSNFDSNSQAFSESLDRLVSQCPAAFLQPTSPRPAPDQAYCSGVYDWLQSYQRMRDEWSSNLIADIVGGDFAAASAIESMGRPELTFLLIGTQESRQTTSVQLQDFILSTMVAVPPPHALQYRGALIDSLSVVKNIVDASVLSENFRPASITADQRRDLLESTRQEGDELYNLTISCPNTMTEGEQDVFAESATSPSATDLNSGNETASLRPTATTASSLPPAACEDADSTGDYLWKVCEPSYAIHRSEEDGSLLLVKDKSLSPGEFITVDTLTGAELGRIETGLIIRTTPFVDVNNVAYFGSSDNSVYAFDLNTGLELWQFSTGERVQSSPTVVDNTVYFGNDEGNLYALDTESGSEQWRFQTNGQIISTPLVAEGIAYIGTSEGAIHAIQTADGIESWQIQIGDRIESTPFSSRGVLYLTSSNDKGSSLHAYDAASGDEKWQFFLGVPTVPSIYVGASAPVVDNETVYVGGSDGNIYAVTAETGEELWRFHPQTQGRTMFSSPVFLNNTLYIGGNVETGGSFSGGVVYAIDGSTGAEVWRFDCLPLYGRVPLIHEDMVYVGAGDALYAVENTANDDQ